MADIQKLYEQWLAKATADPDLKAELESIKDDEDGKNDRFYRDLEFGTGGLRGVIGAGTNRMNVYTVKKATQGLAEYILASGEKKSVAISCDSRTSPTTSPRALPKFSQQMASRYISTRSSCLLLCFPGR